MCATLVLALCCVAIISVTGCEDLRVTTNTFASDTTVTVVSDTTDTVAPGAGLDAASATTTTTIAAAKPKASPTTTVSGAMGAIAAPQPKTKLLMGTCTWDVDGDVDGAVADADLHYVIADELVHYLQAQNGAGLARIVGKSFDAVGRSDLQAIAYTSNRLDTEGVDDPNVLMPGDVFALRTNTGQYAKMEVTGFEAVTLFDGSVYARYNIRLRYVLYPR